MSEGEENNDEPSSMLDMLEKELEITELEDMIVFDADVEQEENRQLNRNFGGRSRRHARLNHMQAQRQKDRISNDKITQGFLPKSLDINRKISDRLSEVLVRVDEKLERNRQRQTMVKHLIKTMLGEPKSKQGGPGKGTFRRDTVHKGAYFKDCTSGETAPAHPQAHRKHELVSKVLIRHPDRKWSEEEKLRLRKALLVVKKRMRVKKLVTDSELALQLDKVRDSMSEEESKEDKDQQRIKNLKILHERLSAMLGKKIQEIDREPDVIGSTANVDWGMLSLEFFRGKDLGDPPTRSKDDCMIQWFGVMDPAHPGGNWTHEEEVVLKKVVEKHQERDWRAIAREVALTLLNKNPEHKGNLRVRTAFDCFKKYQRSHNVHLVKSTWSPEEDDELRRQVAVHGNKWAKIAAKFPGRANNQVRARYKRIQECLKKGNWSVDEDMRLKLAMKAYGTQWPRISDHLPSRAQQQVRERWFRVLAPELKKGSWTKEEDSLLLGAVNSRMHQVQQGSIKWSEISKMLPGRTDKMVNARWKKIANQELVEGYKKLRQIKTANVPKKVFKVRKRSQLGLADYAPGVKIRRTLSEYDAQFEQDRDRELAGVSQMPSSSSSSSVIPAPPLPLHPRRVPEGSVVPLDSSSSSAGHPIVRHKDARS
mmetsp:Transcript_35343/g.68707  ORF Transcript_35343/g.68707 Transcript_35343/m.68707 type:complete len:651 (-) Transcript_35343:89-2041(-)